MTGQIAQQFGNYRLVRHLGRGAFSDVYLGIHVHLKTPAAIKLLHTEITSNDVEKFRNEARTIARLEHPHIVRVLDFGIEDHTPFFVMAYAPNGTLRQRHPKGSILSLAAVVSYVTQIADALQFAHNQKFIHRDIKPENMLLGRHNEVLLSDFGFVQIAQSTISQSTKEMAGTIPYMAPEQFHGKPRYASDQYSLGIVVYEWLTGDRPFQGSVLEIATQHMINPPPPIREKNPAVPLEVEQVLLTALAKEPQQRFATVRAFANAMQQASNIVSPITSASTISFEEVSELPSIATQSISVETTPQVLNQNAPPAFNKDTFENSYTTINSSNQHQMTHVPVESSTSSQRNLSRRAVLFGLVGVAIGSIVSNGIWIAKSAELFTNTPSIGPNSIPTPILPLPGTTLETFTGHTGTVYSAAWAPNGYRIASAGTDKMVLVWDAATGDNIRTYKGHKDYVRSVAWSPDGIYIASGGGNYPSVSDTTVQVWEATTETLFYTFTNHTDAISSIAWSPDGNRIASASYDRSVKIWDAFTGTNILTYPGHSNWVMSISWSPDAKYIASASHDNTVRVWDTTTLKDKLPPLQHANWVQSVSWSHDGNHIASATGKTEGSSEHLVHVWDATSGKPVYIYRGHKDEIATVAWSPNEKRIASAGGSGIYPSPKVSDTTVHVWDALTGANLSTYSGHSEIVWSVAWSYEGSRIASASRDKTVQVWRAE
jgi:WD40 repeat protein/tRNA A-37 threonylcarbamoyl transferase component Bud32